MVLNTQPKERFHTIRTLSARWSYSYHTVRREVLSERSINPSGILAHTKAKPTGRPYISWRVSESAAQRIERRLEGGR